MSVDQQEKKRRPGRPVTIERPEARIDLDTDILRAIENSEEGDKLFFDADKKPDDMEYAWRRRTIGGMPDTQYMAQMKRLGWMAVPASRHPEVGTDDPSGVSVIVGASVLMERHMEYSRRARIVQDKKNAHQVSSQLNHLKLEGDDDSMPRQVTKFKRTYESEAQEILD